MANLFDGGKVPVNINISGNKVVDLTPPDPSGATFGLHADSDPVKIHENWVESLPAVDLPPLKPGENPWLA